MDTHTPSEHFAGKSVVDHLKEARTRGMIASAEIHGLEMPLHLSSFADASKDTAMALLILWSLVEVWIPLDRAVLFLLLFSCSWLIWKTGRSAMVGWGRLERLHRLIEQERWEIEHHRAQEKEELTELYRAKGLTGKLLTEVVDTLMADDNRLLQVMLEEELGLTLETHEHPIKQCLGAFLGTLLTAFVAIFPYWIGISYALPVGCAVALFTSCIISAKVERNAAMPSVIWHLATAFFLMGFLHFLLPLALKMR